MATNPLRPHMHPQEIARRQRWVAVGVTILGLLLVVTWIITLPERLSQAKGGSNLMGTIPESSFIDADTVMNGDVRKAQEEELLQVINELTTVSTSTPVTTATTTPISEPNKQ